MTGFNVTFDDCSDPFTICHCDNANMSMDTVVDRFSRVPVGLRRYVGAVIVAPAEEARAYTLTSGDIHMFGDTDVDVWVHEVSALRGVYFITATGFCSPCTHSISPKARTHYLVRKAGKMLYITIVVFQTTILRLMLSRLVRLKGFD